MEDIEITYSFNFNATSYSPPSISGSTAAFAFLAIFFNITGIVLSLFLLGLLKGEKRVGQRVCCYADIALSCVQFPAIVVSLIAGRVPSMLFCQLNGFTIHAVCTCQFSSITCLAYERFYNTKQVRDGNAGKGKKRPPFWFYLRAVLWPLLVIHAALPILTRGGYGAYGMKPAAFQCYATGGEGVFSHDIFPVMNLAFFVGCTTFIFYSLLSSFFILRGILAKAGADKNGTVAKDAAKIEKKAMLFAVALATTFLGACVARPSPTPMQSDRSGMRILRTRKT